MNSEEIRIRLAALYKDFADNIARQKYFLQQLHKLLLQLLLQIISKKHKKNIVEQLKPETHEIVLHITE